MAACGLGWAAWSAHAEGARRDAGAALFQGHATLPARLVNHDEPLPAVASRCSNCHETLSSTPAVAGAASAPPRVYAVPLDRARLTVSQRRRGGPPSAYDAQAFCSVLRSGVDPARVIIPVTMPRYDIDDGRCRELWSYVTRH